MSAIVPALPSLACMRRLQPTDRLVIHAAVAESITPPSVGPTFEPFLFPVRTSLCGERNSGAGPSDLATVNCKRCLRTKAYREALMGVTT